MKYTFLTEQMSGIYKINFPNGKIYIGRAKNIKRRIWEHYQKDDSTLCQKKLRKYYKSYQDIDVDILEEIPSNEIEKQCEREKYWIAHFNSFINKNIGYNLTTGGDGGELGCGNGASKITQSQLQEIIQALSEGQTNVEIGRKYNMHPDSIGKINNGKTYYNANIEYPIRPKENLDEKYEKVVELLLRTQKTRVQIKEETGIGLDTISNINNGKHSYCKKVSLSFPIRKMSKSNLKFSLEQIENIKRELKNPEYSIQDIAQHFNCSRDTIGDINNGRRYCQANEKYPIRNFYPNRKHKNLL